MNHTNLEANMILVHQRPHWKPLTWVKWNPDLSPRHLFVRVRRKMDWPKLMGRLRITAEYSIKTMLDDLKPGVIPICCFFFVFSPVQVETIHHLDFATNHTVNFSKRLFIHCCVCVCLLLQFHLYMCSIIIHLNISRQYLCCTRGLKKKKKTIDLAGTLTKNLVNQSKWVNWDKPSNIRRPPA